MKYLSNSYAGSIFFNPPHKLISDIDVDPLMHEQSFLLIFFCQSMTEMLDEFLHSCYIFDANNQRTDDKIINRIFESMSKTVHLAKG